MSDEMGIESSPTPLFSIVTVCRNAAATVAATLESVACQQGFAELAEHIVVDGVSTDDTLDIVRRFPHVRWISEPDAGIADAFNKGLHLSRGIYLLYINADDRLHDALVLQDIAAFVQAHAMPEWVVGNLMEKSPDGKLRPRTYRRFPPSCLSLLLRNRIAHPAVVLKRSALVAAGAFNTHYRYAMDFDLWQRLCARGYRPTYCPRFVSVFATCGISSIPSEGQLAERREIMARVRDRPFKRWIGALYDRIKGDYLSTGR